MTALRWVALAALALAAGLAVAVELRHRDQADMDWAILRTRTHRFDGSTRARISTWLTAEAAEAVQWSAEREGLFSRGLMVRLRRAGAEAATFAVAADGTVRPVNSAAEAVVAAVRAHAERPEAPAPPAPSGPARPAAAQEAIPPVRPFVPE